MPTFQRRQPRRSEFHFFLVDIRGSEVEPDQRTAIFKRTKRSAISTQRMGRGLEDAPLGASGLRASFRRRVSLAGLGRLFRRGGSFLGRARSGRRAAFLSTLATGDV